LPQFCETTISPRTSSFEAPTAEWPSFGPRAYGSTFPLRRTTIFYPPRDLRRRTSCPPGTRPPVGCDRATCRSIDKAFVRHRSHPQSARGPEKFHQTDTALGTKASGVVETTRSSRGRERAAPQLRASSPSAAGPAGSPLPPAAPKQLGCPPRKRAPYHVAVLMGPRYERSSFCGPVLDLRPNFPQPFQARKGNVQRRVRSLLCRGTPTFPPFPTHIAKIGRRPLFPPPPALDGSCGAAPRARLARLAESPSGRHLQARPEPVPPSVALPVTAGWTRHPSGHCCSDAAFEFFPHRPSPLRTRPFGEDRLVPARFFSSPAGPPRCAGRQEMSWVGSAPACDNGRWTCVGAPRPPRPVRPGASVGLKCPVV